MRPSSSGDRGRRRGSSTLTVKEELELVYQQFMESLFAEEDGSDA